MSRTSLPSVCPNSTSSALRWAEVISYVLLLSEKSVATYKIGESEAKFHDDAHASTHKVGNLFKMCLECLAH